MENSVKKVIDIIKREYNLDLGIHQRRFCALFYDYAPKLTNERKMIMMLLDSVTISKLTSPRDISEKEKIIILNKLKREFQEDHYFNDQALFQVISIACYIYDWEVPNKAALKLHDRNGLTNNITKDKADWAQMSALYNAQTERLDIYEDSCIELAGKVTEVVRSNSDLKVVIEAIAEGWNAHCIINGVSLLEEIIILENVEVLKFLCDIGFELNDTNSKNEMYIKQAIKTGNENLVRVFFSNVASNVLEKIFAESLTMFCLDNDYKNILMMAGEYGVSLSTLDSTGYNALHRLAFNNRVNDIRFFIDLDINVDVLCDKGYGAFDIATFFGYEELKEMMINREFKQRVSDTYRGVNELFRILSQRELTEIDKYKIDMLIYKRTGLDYIGRNGECTLHKAASNGHVDTLESLLATDINIDMVDSNGCTSIFNAITNGHTMIVKTLIDHGSNVDHEDEKGWTPLSVAISMRQPEITKLLIEAGVKTDIYDYKGNTLLHKASVANIEIVKLLLDQGIDIDYENNENKTALCFAVKSKKKDIVKELLGHNANINTGTQLSNSPILLSIATGDLSIVKLLVDNGAMLDRSFDNGVTCSSYANEKGNKTIEQYINRNMTAYK